VIDITVNDEGRLVAAMNKRILIEPKHDNPIHQGMHVLARLRAAGVPVIGHLWPMGVESGSLTVGVPDLADGVVEYVWRPE
jgi:hypothetical protein